MFYANGSSVNGNEVQTSADLYKANIIKTWSKDSNGNAWTTKYKGEKYTVEFNISVTVDNSAIDENKRQYDGKTNYVGISLCLNDNRNKVYSSNSGNWKYTNSPSNSGAHEFGHFLGLKDRYNDKRTSYEGWENHIMSNIYCKPDQRSIDALVNRNGENLIDKAKQSQRINLLMGCNVQRCVSYYLNKNNREK